MIQNETIKKSSSIYHSYIYEQVKIEINKTLKFINSFCEEKGISSLRSYFWYKSDIAQVYPDSLDHIFRGLISPYYLACNLLFRHYFYSLSHDLKEELDQILKIGEKQMIIKDNKILTLYMKKLLGKSFLF